MLLDCTLTHLKESTKCSFSIYMSSQTHTVCYCHSDLKGIRYTESTANEPLFHCVQNITCSVFVETNALNVNVNLTPGFRNGFRIQLGRILPLHLFAD